VPLVILAVALLGALGLESTWSDSIAPEIRDRVTRPVFDAIDYSVRQILDSTRAGIIAFASLLLLWQLFRGVRAATVALNEIHDVEETRSGRRQLLTAIGLAAAVGACLVFATLVMVVAPRLTTGAADVVLSLVRWPVAIAVLGLCVGLLVRYAPAERPDVRWASIGSAVIVAGWLVLSLAFGFWVTSVASYKGAVGNLAVFLVLTAYVLGASAVFLVGVEIDEAGRARDVAQALGLDERQHLGTVGAVAVDGEPQLGRALAQQRERVAKLCHPLCSDVLGPLLLDLGDHARGERAAWLDHSGDPEERRKFDGITGWTRSEF
jgi:membrane protein